MQIDRKSNRLFFGVFFAGCALGERQRPIRGEAGRGGQYGI